MKKTFFLIIVVLCGFGLVGKANAVSNSKLITQVKAKFVSLGAKNSNPTLASTKYAIDVAQTAFIKEQAEKKAQEAKEKADKELLTEAGLLKTAQGSLNPGGSSLKTPHQLIAYGIKFEMVLMGAIALALYIWAGMLWMTSGGNSERKDKAMKTLLWVTIGLVVVFSSYAMLRFVFSSLITG
ncbi:MAG: hypothetical protein ABIH87_02250 [bacterium]